MDFGKFAVGVGIAAAGVLVAGLIMDSLRGSVELVGKAHKGYDS